MYTYSVVTNVDDHADTGALHSVGREEANVLGLQGVLDKRGLIHISARCKDNWNNVSNVHKKLTTYLNLVGEFRASGLRLGLSGE